MFYGQHIHSIDSKNRLIVPAKYREKLGETCYIVKGFDKCLDVYPEKEWIKFKEKIDNLPTSNRDSRRLKRFLTTSMTEVSFDKQGRIIIQNSHKEYAKLEKDVVIAGAGSKIEIWNKELYDEATTFDDDEMDDVVERLSDLGINF